MRAIPTGLTLTTLSSSLWMSVHPLPALTVSDGSVTPSTPARFAPSALPFGSAHGETTRYSLSASLLRAAPLGFAPLAFPAVAGETQQRVDDIIDLAKHTNNEDQRDEIILSYFKEHGRELTPAQAKQLSKAMFWQTDRDWLIQTYAGYYSEATTLVPDPTPAETWTLANTLTAGGVLMIPALFIGAICYKTNANFRGLVQAGAAILAWPYTASRTALENHRLKRNSLRDVRRRAKEQETAQKERIKRRETLMREIYTWDDESDDIKRDKLIELIPLVMEIADREERAHALHTVSFQGFKEIQSAHYLKPVLLALAVQLKHEAKWRRDTAASAFTYFFTYHPLESAAKRRLLDEITALTAQSSEDTRHDIAAWRAQWETILTKLETGIPESKDTRASEESRRQPQGRAVPT